MMEDEERGTKRYREMRPHCVIPKVRPLRRLSLHLFASPGMDAAAEVALEAAASEAASQETPRKAPQTTLQTHPPKPTSQAFVDQR